MRTGKVDQFGFPITEQTAAEREYMNATLGRPLSDKYAQFEREVKALVNLCDEQPDWDGGKKLRATIGEENIKLVLSGHVRELPASVIGILA